MLVILITILVFMEELQTKKNIIEVGIMHIDMHNHIDVHMVVAASF